MALKTNVPGHGSFPIYDDSFIADGALASLKNTMVAYSAQSSGQPQVATPSGEGVFAAGVLLNDDDVADGGLAAVRLFGIAKVKASAALNAGIEVKIASAAGTIAAAATGDYVVGISLEAAAEAGQLIKVFVNCVGATQKN